MSETYYLTGSGEWKTRAEIVLDAIDIVCGSCCYVPEDESGIDPCEGCMVVETAGRMNDIIRRNSNEQL